MIEDSLLNEEINCLSNNYQDHSNLQWSCAIESLKKISFNSTDKVLDVGCGDGKITAFIAKQISNGIVIGLDISKEMLVSASSHYPSSIIYYFLKVVHLQSHLNNNLIKLFVSVLSIGYWIKKKL